MFWFRYRWVLIFSHGLCVKIIRASARVQELSNQVDSLSSTKPMNWAIGILNRISELTNILDDIVFSVSALLYREERDLIKFSKRIKRGAEKLIERLKKERRKYQKDIYQMRKLKILINQNEQLKKAAEKADREKEKIAEDEQRRTELVGLFHKVTNFIQHLDDDIHKVHLESKAQERGVLNKYLLKEQVIIRSNYRLGKLTRRRAIELGAVIKNSREKLKKFQKIVGKKKRLNAHEITKVLECLKVEAEDLESIFVFAVQISERVEKRLKELGLKIQEESKLYKEGRLERKDLKLQSLIGEFNETEKKLKDLRGDILTQYKRLDNEVKKATIQNLSQSVK